MCYQIFKVTNTMTKLSMLLSDKHTLQYKNQRPHCCPQLQSRDERAQAKDAAAKQARNVKSTRYKGVHQ